VLSLAPADATNGGVVTNTTQTFGGKKTIDINIVGGATGSIPYQSGPSVTTLLATGATGTILTSSGPNLAPTWATIPVAKIFANSAQNIPQNVNYFTTQTQLTCLGGIQTNTASMTATANAITIPKSGYYMVIGSLQLAVSSQISLQVYVTSGVGAPYILARNESASGNYGSGFGSNWWQASGIQYLSTGDVLILTAWQNGVVAPGAAVANILSYLSVAFISV
jgi:hypothetical protein